MPFGGSKFATFRLKESRVDGAVFDNGSHPLIASFFSLLIATCSAVVWLNPALDLKGAGKVLAGAGVFVLAIFGVFIFVHGTTRIELRTDRTLRRVEVRRTRLWGRWIDRWSVEAREVRSILLRDDAVTLRMMDGQTLRVDWGTDSDSLRVLAAQLSDALAKPLEELREASSGNG